MSFRRLFSTYSAEKQNNQMVGRVEHLFLFFSRLHPMKFLFCFRSPELRLTAEIYFSLLIVLCSLLMWFFTQTTILYVDVYRIKTIVSSKLKQNVQRILCYVEKQRTINSFGYYAMLLLDYKPLCTPTNVTYARAVYIYMYI